MARLSPDAIMLSLLAIISPALGCGVMPADQKNTKTFNLTGFALPIVMVCSSTPGIQVRFPGIAPNEAPACSFGLKVPKHPLSRRPDISIISTEITSWFECH
ncbi:hypothetical protein KIN20_009961 [Parelaphostrongylus tenuis]|uniref:Secreted protein n=1 Tax=Parelaphostrongylus tenuis TaxID=148309 RepID=A0AAD5QNR4_PARTN|nr:hypothetical protein KIN20_009961 [Parelaphostrongylus tenuis]